MPAPAPDTRSQVAEIDASCRGPLLWLFESGVLWLLLGLVLALLASIKMHAPGFLADYAWLTFGRVRPAAVNALLYGFATPTALGVSLWMLCRLGGVRLPAPFTTLIAVMFWNFGVTLGVLAILAQGSTGFEWLDMPRYVAPLLFLAYLILGLVGLTAFHLRKPLTLHGAAPQRRPATYVTQWYILGGLLWFAWLYSAANLLLLYRPVRGVLQAAVNAWYTNNLFHLWLSSIGLGAIFYFLPKLLGRPLASRRLAAFGFWTLALFGSWSGMTQFIGGPLPAWMVSTSVGANSLLLVPLLALAINWHLTLRGHYREAWRDVTLRFVLFGAASYLLALALGVVLGLPGVSRATHFTCLETARTWLGLLGFVLMVLLGSLYYILPRLARVNWPYAAAVRLHFWCSAGGVALLVLALALGGIIQGVKMNLNTVDFITLGRATVPFVGLATLGWLGLLVGQAFFVANVLALLRRFAEPYRQAAVAGFRRNGQQPRRQKP
jgi:cytochrome c oxidase cbb3-type subunit 1